MCPLARRPEYPTAQLTPAEDGTSATWCEALILKETARKLRGARAASTSKAGPNEQTATGHLRKAAVLFLDVGKALALAQSRGHTVCEHASDRV